MNLGILTGFVCLRAETNDGPCDRGKNFWYQHNAGNMADQLLHTKKDSLWSRNWDTVASILVTIQENTTSQKKKSQLPQHLDILANNHNWTATAVTAPQYEAIYFKQLSDHHGDIFHNHLLTMRTKTEKFLHLFQDSVSHTARCYVPATSHKTDGSPWSWKYHHKH